MSNQKWLAAMNAIKHISNKPLLAGAFTQSAKVQDEVTVRSKRYTVDGVIPGYTVKIVALKAMTPNG
jgi:hypothetical protein